jgi:hypothetical protein
MAVPAVVVCVNRGGRDVSIIRVGLAETKKFAAGYEAIFGKAKKKEAATAEPSAAKKQTAKTPKKKAKKR